MKCCVKYFISCVTVVTVLFSVFCVSSLAAINSTEETFTSFGSDQNDCLFNNSSASFFTSQNKYTFTREIASHEPWEFWYANSSRNSFGSFEFRFHTDDDFIDLYNNYILQFTVNDITTVGLSGYKADAGGNKPYIRIKYKLEYNDDYYTGWKNWEDFTFTRNTAGEFVVDFNFYYHNKGENITDILFQIGFYNYGTVNPQWVGIMFPEYAVNCYNDSANNPSAPSYVSPGNTYQGSLDSNNELVDDFTQKEEEVMNGTESGRNEFSSLLKSLGDTVTTVSSFLLAVSMGLNYFINGSVLLQSILYISLTLGFVAFLFNVVPSLSYTARASRDRERYFNRKNKKEGG